MSDRPGITSELRAEFSYEMATDSMTRTSASIDAGELMDLCNAIDSVHSALEAENERLRQDVAICSESEQEKCIDYLHKENIDWEDKYLHVAVENARLREQIDTLVMYVESDGTKYSVDEDGNQHFDHSNTCMPDGWVELPLDADGVPIHIGDVMVYEDGDTCPLPVVALVPPAVFFTDMGPRYADMCRHYHAPTVEDVLEELLREYDRDDSELTNGEIVEMFAKRLTLAGDAE